MRLLVYIAIAFTIISCVGNTTTRPTEKMNADSTSTIVVGKDADSITKIDSSFIDVSQQQADSIIFRITHHYSLNFNFLVKSDSLTLVPREGDIISDTCIVRAGDIVAVADIKIIPSDSIDSIWVKVASSQVNMGWIPEHELLKGTTPDDIISEIIDMLSGSRIIWMTLLALLGISGLIIKKKGKSTFEKIHDFGFLNQMNSPYQYVFLIITAVLASYYATIQNFVPEFWQEYYFHPTLNPLVLPPTMATLLILAWLVIITFLAVIDEVYHNFYFIPGITFLRKLLGVAMLVYLLVSWTTLIYIGYPILIFVIIYLVRKILKVGKDNIQD